MPFPINTAYAPSIRVGTYRTDDKSLERLILLPHVLRALFAVLRMKLSIHQFRSHYLATQVPRVVQRVQGAAGIVQAHLAYGDVYETRYTSAVVLQGNPE